jgi:hypothetical protein
MKGKIIGLVVGTAILVLPVAAFASVNIQNLTLDGLANTTVNVGDTINAQATYAITSNDDVESLSWELVGSGLPQTCVDIPDQINGGTWHPQFDINTNGATAGSWDVKIKLFGVNGAGTDQQCGTTAKDTMTFTNRVAITEQTSNNTGVGSGTGSTSGTGGTHLSQLDQLIALLTALVHPSTGGTGTPTTSAICSAFNAANVGTQPNVYSSANIALQGFLLSQHMSIPALTSGGAAFGFYGNQTTAAVGTFNSINHC